MQVRGAPLIGVAAAYGICLALKADASDENLERACVTLLATRPTAINLKWALDEMTAAVRNRPRAERVAAAYRRAAEICRGGRRDQPGDRSARPQADRGDRRYEEKRRARQRAHPLQRRLARRRRRRHRDRADLSGARPGSADPCLGRRDASAQPGRIADGLGARPARRAAHGDPGQHGRSSDAARQGRHGDRRHRPGRRRTATSATRSAPI